MMTPKNTLDQTEALRLSDLKESNDPDGGDEKGSNDSCMSLISDQISSGMEQEVEQEKKHRDISINSVSSRMIGIKGIPMNNSQYDFRVKSFRNCNRD